MHLISATKTVAFHLTAAPILATIGATARALEGGTKELSPLAEQEGLIGKTMALPFVLFNSSIGATKGAIYGYFEGLSAAGQSLMENLKQDLTLE